MGSIDYKLSAAYNLADQLKSITYPSNHTVSYDYDAAGRLITFSGYLGDGSQRNYATELTYSSLGGMTKEKFGTTTAIYNKLFYNSRGQLSEIRVSSTSATDTSWNRGAIINHYSDQCWGMCGGSNNTTYTMTDNNGNLRKQDVYIPNDDQVSSYDMHWQEYEYDPLNRLKSAREVYSNAEQWKQQFTYDRWGNRLISPATTVVNSTQFKVDPATNQLFALNDVFLPDDQTNNLMKYDAGGNLKYDNYTGVGSRTYDAENKMTSAWGGQPTAQTQSYVYDASGQRIKRTVNGVETWQVYGFGGELVAEYAASGAISSPQKEYGYRNGQLLVTAEPLAQSTQNVTWTNATGVSVSTNNLTKNVSDSWTNSGASSQQSLSAGDGYLEVTASETNTYRMIGLSNGDTNQNYSDIDFAAYLYGGSGGLLCVYEAGTDRGCPSTFTNGDVIRVAVESGVVKYKKNGTTFYTSSVTPTYPLNADTALYSNGATLNNVKLSGTFSGSAATLHWLVADHLGTPRMILDQSGSLANVKRHDYLPFGEELGTGISGRTGGVGGRGYGGGEGVRQQFTAKERDSETWLDYFGARYFSSSQGRFISVDPIGTNFSRQLDPQQLNRYSTTRNNPLKYTDPDGRDLKLAQGVKKSDSDFILKRVTNLYRKATGRNAIERMEKSDITFEMRAGSLPTKTNLFEGTISEKFGETKRVRFTGTPDPANPTKVGTVDRKSGVVEITFDFNKRTDAQNSYDNGQRPQAPLTEQHLVDHELGHADDMNNDMAKEANQTESDAERNAENFANKAESEPNSMSSEEAEKRSREILGLPPKPEKKEKKKND